MNHDAGQAQHDETHDVREGGNHVQLARGIRHHRDGERGIDETAEVHLPERDYKPGIDRQQQEKIEFASANQLGEVRAIDQEEGLENLLNEVTAANEENHLPFCPGADVIG